MFGFQKARVLLPVQLYGRWLGRVPVSRAPFDPLSPDVDTPDADGSLLKDHILALVGQGKELHFIAKVGVDLFFPPLFCR